MKRVYIEENKMSRKLYLKPYLSCTKEQKHNVKTQMLADKILNRHLESDIKESKKSIEEDKELEKTLGKLR